MSPPITSHPSKIRTWHCERSNIYTRGTPRSYYKNRPLYTNMSTIKGRTHLDRVFVGRHDLESLIVADESVVVQVVVARTPVGALHFRLVCPSVQEDGVPLVLSVHHNFVVVRVVVGRAHRQSDAVCVT